MFFNFIFDNDSIFSKNQRKPSSAILHDDMSIDYNFEISLFLYKESAKNIKESSPNKFLLKFKILI